MECPVYAHKRWKLKPKKARNRRARSTKFKDESKGLHRFAEASNLPAHLNTFTVAKLLLIGVGRRSNAKW
jgi:hypothetical protein